MDIDELISDTFVAHEGLAPDERDVLDAVRRRTARRRPSLVRPMAVAASVAVVAGTAGAVVLLTDDHRPRADSAPRPVASSSAEVPSVPAAPVRSKATPVAPRIPDLTMPFDVGWLPAGTVENSARRIIVGAAANSSVPVYNGEYLLVVRTPTRDLLVDVQQMAGGLEIAGFKSGGGADVTINGRRGIESAHSGGPGGYEVYFRGANGGTIYVNVGPEGQKSPPSAAEMTAIGRRVAGSVTFPGTTTVTPSFAIGNDLPGGLQAKAFDISDPGDPSGSDHSTRTSYELYAPNDTIDDGVSVFEDPAGEPDGAKAGRTVQGHPTRYADENGYRTLTVLGAVDGQAIAVAGSVSLRDLYAIADGLVLPER